MADWPTSSGEPSPEQRDRLLRLLIDELANSWDAAVAAGGERERLAQIIDERRQALEPPPPPGTGPDD